MIEKFEQRQIERFLRESGLRYLIDQDGDYIVSFYGDDIPDYRVQFSAEGVDNKVLAVCVSADVPYPEHMRERIEGLVAGWNRRMRWPKARSSTTDAGVDFT
jgi:hypothetical protein